MTEAVRAAGRVGRASGRWAGAGRMARRVERARGAQGTLGMRRRQAAGSWTSRRAGAQDTGARQQAWALGARQ